MVEMLARSIQRLVHKIGASALVGFSLLFVLISSLVWWLNQFSGRAASPTLGSTTFLALLLGWLLARRRSPGWLAALLAALVGLFTVTALAGELLGPFLAWAQSAISLGIRVRGWQPNQPLPDPTLTGLLAQDLGLRLTELAQRGSAWVSGVLRGAPGFDPLAAGLVWGLLLWCAAAWAAWGVRRRGQPLLAALPAVAILAASLAFARGQLLYLFPPFAAVLGLLAWSQYNRHSQEWQQGQVDYATDIPFDLTLWTGSIIVVLGALAMAAATPSPHQAVRFTRALLVPRGQAAEGLGQSLGLSPGAGQVQVTGPGGVMPRQHLLGSGPELSQRVVYLATVFDTSGNLVQQSAGEYYWRAVTYDQYDGRGWKSSPTTAERYPAGESLPVSAQPGGYRWIEQEIQAVGDAGLQVVQSGDLVQLDQAFEIDLRVTPPDELDPFGARLERPPSAGDYRALSRQTAPSQVDLAAAGYDYPLWIAERYLELPSDLPPRVQELARQITAEATTPYARAQAIEAYLRLIPYTLDLPAPPPDRDVADYYLFDLRRGYCDYAATAMAVLARSVGLPSRLVVGYAPGRYDASTRRSVITEAEAHSWPEIFFSGVGWVAFEPTGGRPPNLLPAGPASAPAPEPQALNPTGARPGWRDLLWPALAGLVLLVLGIWGWVSWQANHRGEAAALTAIYAGIRRSGRRLGAPDSPGLTPGEVAVALGDTVERLALNGRLGRLLATAAAETQHLTELYARAIYSPQPPGAAEVNSARAVWHGLRWRLFLVRLIYRRRDFRR